MKKYLSVFAVFLLFNVTFAFEKTFSNKDFNFVLESSKDFVAGSNNFSFSIKKDSKAVEVQNLKIVFFMPEMPGMPKMSEEANLTKNNDKYIGSVNLVHGGTWQVKVSFNIDGKKYQAKSSIDF